MVEENTPPDNSQQPSHQARPRVKKKKVRAKAAAIQHSAFDRVVAAFSACARCSYFFTGYRALFNDEQVEQQIAQSSDIWLQLIWSHQVAHLLHGSFGREITADLVKYQLCCPECLRLYSYEQPENETPRLQIQLDPQRR